MKLQLLAALAAAVVSIVLPALAASSAFRAPNVPAQAIVFAAPTEKSSRVAPPGVTEVGDVRPVPKAAPMLQWHPVAGGYVARVRAESATALGLRVRLDLGTVPGSMEVRVQGSDPARIETMPLDPTLGTAAWTPWTEGDSQLIEIFSAVAPSDDAVRVGAVLHMNASPFPKAAATCTISTACSSGDATLDAQITERKKSLMRISFVDGGKGYLCSATLIDTPRNPAAYVLTANHCIGTQSSAGSITSFWFYEAASCGGSGTNPGMVQTAGGAQLVFTNPNVDSTLVLMNQSPPAAATYSPLNAALLADGTAIVSISHPQGDTSRWADGVMDGLARPYGSDLDLPYDMYGVTFSRGMIQAGSSGSGLFTRTNGHLALAGMLSLGPDDESCTSTDNRHGLYDRLEVFYPQMAQYIGAASVAADDAPNRTVDVSSSILAAPVDTFTQQPAITVSRRIDYAGDVDLFRFEVSSPVAVSAYTTGNLDSVIAMLGSDGSWLGSNDDAQTAGMGNNAGLTRVLQPGTYYVNVGNWDPAGTGPYSLALRADRVDTNSYTALWYNPAEDGWGLSLDHQGFIIFGVLYTYEDSGAPMWVVMPRGERQADGSYSGPLYRTTGAPFNAVPWTGNDAPSQVGTMRLAFQDANNGTVTYSVNGRNVSRPITRQNFKTPPTCSWSIFDRSFEVNVQDLWWNDTESGWGINIAHQSDTLFATLFTYDTARKGLWLVMPDGELGSDGIFRGDLYQTHGVAFDAQPWTKPTNVKVGTMSFDFADGNSGTLTYSVNGITVTKQIKRQVFSSPTTRCVS